MAMLAAVDAMKASKTAQSVNLKVFFEGEEEAGSRHLREILVKYAPLLASDGWLFCDGPVHQSGKQQLVVRQSRHHGVRAHGVRSGARTAQRPLRQLGAESRRR